MKPCPLGTLITYNPWTVQAATPLEDVAANFSRLGVHHVAVVDGDRRLVGMLSETDLLRARQNRAAVAVGGGVEESLTCGPVFAREVMSADVLAISPASTQREALNLLLEHRIHALPVASEERLVGIISSRDFVREFSYGESPSSRLPIAERLKAPPQMLEPETTLDQALLIMHETGASCLAVGMGECPLGVLSQRDIVRARRTYDEDFETGAQFVPPTVIRIIRESPAMRPGQRLCEAAAAMVAGDLPAVTVINQANRLLGLVTEDDILRWMYDEAA